MELDKRIKEGKRPLTCLDVEQAREFEGKQCLFSDSYVNYKNIREYAKYPQYTGTLSVRDKFKYIASEESPYRNANDGYFYELVLPLEWIEEPEKKYRAFTNEEFIKLFDSGKLHSIRLKDSSTERLERLVITDIYVQGDYLYAKLNGSDTGYGTEYFFSKCEYFDGKEWKPFGIEFKE